MKGKKRIGILALSMLFVGVASACNNEVANKQVDSVDYINTGLSADITIEDTDTTELRSILLDSSNVKKTFYIGEEFNSDGLIVKRTLAVIDKDGKSKGNVNVETDDYTVNHDEVDMTKPGRYTVTVTHRHKNKILERTYTVDVKSALFETTKDLVYNAGLEVSFGDDKKIKNYLVTNYDDGSGNYDTNFNATSLRNGLKIKLHKYTSDGNTSEESEVIDLSSTDVSITGMPRNVNAVGTYVVKITYDAAPVTINNVQYDNSVSSFVIINVVNPIKSIQLANGAQEIFEQSLDGIDVEKAGWKVTYYPTVGDAVTEDFSYKKYKVEGLDIFKLGTSQELTISSIEDPSVKCVKNIIVQESQTEDITPYINLAFNSTDVEIVDGKYTHIFLAGTDFIHGPLPKTIDKVATSECVTTGADYVLRSDSDMSKTDYYESLKFPERIAIKGTEVAIRIDMDKPGKIVVFFAGTNGESDLCLYGSDSTGSMKKETILQTLTSADEKQKVGKGTFEIDEAGTYYIANPVGGVYVHGFIIAKSK